jgi:hypothetical protein
MYTAPPPPRAASYLALASDDASFGLNFISGGTGYGGLAPARLARLRRAALALSRPAVVEAQGRGIPNRMTMRPLLALWRAAP